MNELLIEANHLAAKGVKEFIIIGQDTTDYGKDIYGRRNLAGLLSNLSEIDGIEWIRIMYAYPSHFPEDVIDVIANNEKICKYIDVPLQHISDDVLKSMRRGITKRKIKELIENLRARIPNIIIRTTFIVGYPAEKEKDFEELCEFVRETKFDRLGVFTYSKEESTSSFILGDPVSEEKKKRRLEVLMEIQKEISAEKNKELLGTRLRVLVENRENGYYVGRSYRDAPEIDGDVLIQAPYSEIQFVKTTSGFESKYNLTVSVFDEDKENLLVEKSWSEKITTKEFDQTTSKTNYNLSLRSFNLEAGKYLMRTSFEDVDSRKEYAVENLITVRKMEQEFE